MEIKKEQQPAKAELKINFSGSGVNTLCGVANFCFVISAIFLAGGLITAGVIGSGYEYDELWWIPFVSGVSSFVFFLAIGAICKAIAEIGRTALYQKHIIEKEYDVTLTTNTTTLK